MEDKDRIALLLTAVQVFGPTMTDAQIAAVVKELFASLGCDLPDAPSPEAMALAVG